jgi:predicted ATPase/DNA-binding SARP family transcriptional activator
MVCPVELCVFGPVAARGSAGPIALPRAKERALLAALALYHGRVVSKDRLVDAVWADGPPAGAEKVLRTHVHRLRSSLGDGVIETHSDGYALAPEVVVDAELFETEASASDSVQGLRAALARWNGEPYADLGEWAPAELERTRLAELRDGALETCLALEIEAGGATGCIAELEAMTADKPLRERRWILLMTALSRDGRVADALRTYQRARKVFAEELGIDPGPELRTLEEQILLADLQKAPGNLPRQLTSFVGRERPSDQLAALLHDQSLVTLTGVGGVGKTRLAIQVAARVAPEFPDGAWFCELAPVADPDAVWESLGVSLGVRQSPGRSLRDVVLEYLAAKRLLLVLDNCEHLLPAVTAAVTAIGQRCARVAVLATSRERLALPGEQNVTVFPLPIPLTDDTVGAIAKNDSIRLFCDRAHDADDTFTLTDRNATAVAELCRHLDGLPLGIELAAARVRSLSPGDLVARIEERFRLLTKGNRSTSERHQTLRNTIDWSYDLLANAEQRALNCMSVFAGGCDLASAEAVLGADDFAPLYVVDLLSELVDKSLVEIETIDGSSRYRLLETIRQYAHEQLEAAGETARVRDSHLACYAGVAEEAVPHLRGRDAYEWAAVMARESDNFRAAFNWAVEAELADEGLRLAVSLASGQTVFQLIQTDWVETAMSIPDASRHQLYPAAAAMAAIGASMRVDLDRAATLAAIAQDAQTRLGTHCPGVHIAAGLLAMFQGDTEQAQRHALMGVDLARATQDPAEVVGALTFYAGTLQPDSTKAAVVAEEAVRVARAEEDFPGLLGVIFPLASMVAHQDPARAQALVDEGAEVARKLGDRWAVAVAVSYQGGNALVQEDWPTALRATTDAIELDLQLGGTIQLEASFLMASAALAHLHLLEPAAVLVGFVEAHFPGLAVDQGWQDLLAASDQLVLDTLGETTTSELKAHGATLTNADASAYLRIQRDRVLGDEPKPHHL